MKSDFRVRFFFCLFVPPNYGIVNTSVKFVKRIGIHCRIRVIVNRFFLFYFFFRRHKISKIHTKRRISVHGFEIRLDSSLEIFSDSKNLKKKKKKNEKRKFDTELYNMHSIAVALNSIQFQYFTRVSGAIWRICTY